MKRTILHENVCHLCSDHPEDVKHALWGCSKVRQVWQRRFGWLDSMQGDGVSFSDLVQLAHTKLSLFPLFAVTAWMVWHHRNKSRLQAATLPLDKLADFAGEYLQNFADRNVKQTPAVRSEAIAVCWCWSPPSENRMKINFDGALFGESDSAGIGVVIRNSEGVVLVALSEKIMKPQGAKMVEILAARRAVLFSRESGFFNPVLGLCLMPREGTF